MTIETTVPRVDPALAAGNRRTLADYAAHHFEWHCADGVATIAVGAISEADHVNSIIAAGRADLCAIARPHLANPAWTLLESAKIGYTEIEWPRQYRAGKAQLERNLERERAQAAQGAGVSALEQANRALGV